MNQTERQRRSTVSIYDELNLYTGLMRSGADPEEFWDSYNERLMQLSALAHRVMMIIPSSASTERTFSMSKRIQGLHRAHMNRTTLEDQVILCSNEELADVAYDLAVAKDHNDASADNHDYSSEEESDD